MYTFQDRGDRSLTLRPEATAPICRAYLQHGMHRSRSRQALHARADVALRPAAEGPVPRALAAFGRGDRIGRPCRRRGADPVLRRAAEESWRYRLRPLPQLDRRPELPAGVRREARGLAGRARLRARRRCARQALHDAAARLRREERAGCRRSSPKRRRSARTSATSAASTSSRCAAFLDAVGVRYELEPTLVRGLDYYTRTTFEFKDEAIGAQSAICGGGRYDGLIEAIGGPPTPGIGFGAGIERLLLSLESPSWSRSAIDVFFVADEGADRTAIAKALAELRRRGSPPTWTTRAARSRASGRRRAASTRDRWSSSSGRDAGRRRDREELDK